MNHDVDDSELAAVVSHSRMVGVHLPLVLVKLVQIIVPYQRDGGEDEGRDGEVAECQSKEDVETTVSVQIQDPDDGPQFNHVGHQRPYPGQKVPAC